MTAPEIRTTPPLAQPVWPGQQPPRPGDGLAITAIVLSSLALLGVLVVGAMGALLVFAGGSFDTYTLRADVETSQGQVARGDLEQAIRGAVEEDGGTVSKLKCPENPKAGSGLSAVCDATIDDVGWVAVVVFESDQGEFALALY